MGSRRKRNSRSKAFADDDYDDDHNGIGLCGCLGTVIRAICLCGCMTGRPDEVDDVGVGGGVDNPAFEGRDLHLSLWPDYDDSGKYMPSNLKISDAYDIYVCGCVPMPIARPVTRLCCGCHCAHCWLSGDRHVGWLLSSRAGRILIFAWISVFLVLLLGGLLWIRSQRLYEIETSPCFVCEMPRDGDGDGGRRRHADNPLTLVIRDMLDAGGGGGDVDDGDGDDRRRRHKTRRDPAVQALARYATYAHGIPCALDDGYVRALDRAATQKWWSDWQASFDERGRQRQQQQQQQQRSTGRSRDLWDAWTMWDRYLSGGPEAAAARGQKKPGVGSKPSVPRVVEPTWRKGVPSVFLIGCRGGGTTSMGHYLSAHPQLWVRRYRGGPATGSIGAADKSKRPFAGVMGATVSAGEPWDEHFFSTLPDWMSSELVGWIRRGWPSAAILAAEHRMRLEQQQQEQEQEEQEEQQQQEEDAEREGNKDKKSGKHHRKRRRHHRGRRGKRDDKDGSSLDDDNNRPSGASLLDRLRESSRTRRLRRVRDHYHRQNDGWTDSNRIRIEVGPDYYWSVGLGTAAAIRRANPRALFVVLLADPVELVEESHARAVEAGLEDRQLHVALADELPALLRCLSWDGATGAEQRERLVTGACGGLQPGPGPPYLWRGMVGEFLAEWMRVLPGRSRYYFVRSTDLLRQPNRTLNRMMVDFMGAGEFNFGPYVRKVYRPRASDLRKTAGAAWASWRSTVGRMDYIAHLRKKASDALLLTATSAVQRLVPGAATTISMVEQARRLHCRMMTATAAALNVIEGGGGDKNSKKKGVEGSLAMYNCERESRDTEDNRRRANRGRNRGVDEEPPSREEVMAVVRRFFEPYQRRLVQMAVRSEEMLRMGGSSRSKKQ